MGALQWLHCSSPVGLCALLSVLLQFLHLCKMICSSPIAISIATCLAFFNLSYAPLADSHILTKFSNMLEPYSVSLTSGWNCNPNLASLSFCMAWTLHDSLSATTTKPSGMSVTSSLWLSACLAYASSRERKSSLPLSYLCMNKQCIEAEVRFILIRRHCCFSHRP